MKHKLNLKRLVRSWRTVIYAGLILALLAVAVPQSVQAATTCRAYYTVKDGDTTPYISHTYNLKWRDIANANDLDLEDKLTVGQRLCIPPESASTKEETTSSTGNKTKVRVPETDANAVVLVSITGKRIGLTTRRFSENHTYLVKVRDAYTSIGGWYKIENINIKKSTTQNFNFNVPKDLRTTSILSVCLKDLYSDELVCRQSVNP